MGELPVDPEVGGDLEELGEVEGEAEEEDGKEVEDEPSTASHSGVEREADPKISLDAETEMFQTIGSFIRHKTMIR